ncbi:NifU family protein [soil metagenome]
MQPSAPESEGWVARLDALLETLGEHPDPEVRSGFAELIDGLHRLHAEGIARLVELLADDPASFARALDDPTIANLLLLYDLAVVDERERANRALESVRPLLRSRGGGAELVGVEEGVVHLNVTGTGDAWAVSAELVVHSLDRAFAERLPGYRELHIDSPECRRSGVGWAFEASGTGEWVSFVPVENLRRAEDRLRKATVEAPREPAHQRVAAAVLRPVLPLAELSDDEVRGVLVENQPVLLARVNGELVGYRNACPGSLLPLHLGSNCEGGTIRCPWHGCLFDLATGSAVGHDRGPLQRLPVSLANGMVCVHLP